MSSPPYVLEIGTDGIAVLSIDRPKQLNSINYETASALAKVLAEIAAMPDLRALVIRGNGAAFCAGGDVASMNVHIDGLPAFADSLITCFNQAVVTIRRMNIPVIASVHGSAAGVGFSLAMACDLVVATRSAKFVVAYLKLAASPDCGLTYFLTRRMGNSRALDLMLLRDLIKAEDAHAAGLVNYLADDDKLEEATMEVAHKLAKLPKFAVGEYKSLVSAVDFDELEKQLERERISWVRCAGTEEIRGRIKAFVERAAKG